MHNLKKRTRKTLVMLWRAFLLSGFLTVANVRSEEAQPNPSPIEVTIQTSYPYQIRTLAFSPDGRTLAAAGGSAVKAVRLWDIASRRQIRTLPEEADLLAFSKDGRILQCSSGGGRLGSWNVADGNLERVFTTGLYSVMSNDGSTTAGDDILAGVKILDLVTSNEVKLPKHVRPLALSHDGTFVALSGAPGEGVVWDTKSGQQVYSFELPRSLNAPLQFGAKDTVLAFASGDGTLTMIIDWPQHPSVFRQKLPAQAKALAISQSYPALVAVGLNEPWKSLAMVSIYDAATGQLVHSNNLPTYSGGPLCFSPDGKYLAINVWRGGPAITLWNSRAERELAELRGSVSPITSVIRGPDSNTLISAGSDGMTCFWDLSRARQVKTVIGTNFGQQSLALSPDGRTLAMAVGVNIAMGDYGTIGNIERLSLPDGRSLPPLKDAKGPVWCLAYSPDGSILAAGGGETFSDSQNQICLWNTTSGRISVRCHGHKGAVRSLAFAPDGKSLVSAGDDSTVRVWDIPSGVLSKTFQSSSCQSPSLAVSPDGRWIAVAAINLYVWEMRTGKLILTTDSNPPSPADVQLDLGSIGPFAASTVAFSPNDFRLAVGTTSGEIHAIDVSSRSQLFRLDGHSAEVMSLNYSADGNRLVSGSSDGSVRLWSMPQKLPTASLISVPPNEYVIMTRDHYYSASKYASGALAFAVGAQAYSFDQFDLVYNRPDKVLEALDGDREIINSLNEAWRSRIVRQGFSPQSLATNADVPLVSLVSTNLALSVESNSFEFSFQATDPIRHLARLQVSINNVPEYGVAGLDVNDKSARTLTHQASLRLLRGQNHIEFWAVNEAGTESLRESLEITCTAPYLPGKLYFIGVGVSQYANSDYNNLHFAAKDAVDLGSFLKSRSSHFENVDCILLTNELATRSSILSACRKLTQTSPEDEVVLFFAGHGKLDVHGQYFFGTYDINFQSPGPKGLNYEAIEGLLDGVSARRKLILIDTCQAGEVNTASTPGIASIAKNVTGSTLSSGDTARSLEIQESPVMAFRNSLMLVQDLFSDLRRGAGEHVIVAVTGSNLAGERESLGNGVFTHCVLEGLRDQKADKNKDGAVSVSELRDFVSDRVQQLSGGEQTPSVRRENVEFDFPIL